MPHRPVALPFDRPGRGLGPVPVLVPVPILQRLQKQHALPQWLALFGLLSAVLPCAAQQYKVVGADGSITYTDRPPATSTLRITPIGKTPGASAAATAAAKFDPNLPVELRQLTQRYPVTLYTTANCQPCDAGRLWLAQRGVPYNERSVLTAEDEQALAVLVGGRSVPSLTIGAQPVRGFAEADWMAYLDAAGYPREGKLPRGWQPPAVTPLTEAAPRPAEPRPASNPPRPAPAVEAAPAPGLRF